MVNEGIGSAYYPDDMEWLFSAFPTGCCSEEMLDMFPDLEEEY